MSAIPVCASSQNKSCLPIRVHRVRVPTLQNSILFLFVLALGIIVSFSLALILVLLMLESAFRKLQEFSAMIALTLLIALPSGGIIMWIWGYNIFRHTLLLKRSRLRTIRLTRVGAYPTAVRRVPHRLVEQLFRSPRYSQRRLGRLLATIPTRHVFMIEDAADAPWMRPPPCEIPFEPVDISEDSPHVEWLIDAYVPKDLGVQSDDHLDIKNADEVVREPWRIRYQRVVAYAGWFGFSLLGFLFLIYLGYRLIRSANPWLLGPFALVVFLWVLWGVSCQRRWWLVPGGLIYREVRAWRKGMKIRMLTPDDTPLVVDLRTGHGMLLDQGRRRTFFCGQWVRWLVVAGWISRARRPTEEEVRSFLESGTK